MALGDTLKQPINQLNVFGYRKACFVLMDQRETSMRTFTTRSQLKPFGTSVQYGSKSRGVTNQAIPDERKNCTPLRECFSNNSPRLNIVEEGITLST